MPPMPLPNMAFMPVQYPMAGPESRTGGEERDSGFAGTGPIPVGMPPVPMSQATVLMPPATGLAFPVVTTPEPGSPQPPYCAASASPLLSCAQRLVDSMRSSPDGRADSEALEDLQRQMDSLRSDLSAPSGSGAGPRSRMTLSEAKRPGPSAEAVQEGAEGPAADSGPEVALAPERDNDTAEGLRQRHLERFDNVSRPEE